MSDNLHQALKNMIEAWEDAANLNEARSEDDLARGIRACISEARQLIEQHPEPVADDE